MFKKSVLAFSILLWLTPIAGVYSFTLEENRIKEEINKLDTSYTRLSAKIYKTVQLKSSNTYANIKDIKSLKNAVSALEKNSSYFKAIQLIKRQESLIRKNIDDSSIFLFLKLLLTQNEWHTANSLFQHIKKEGDKSLISNVKFIFSEYYFNRNKWNKTLNTLDGIHEDLSRDNGHYSLIMNGVVLQKLKKHRQALRFYRKVPTDSVYYHYAKLNTAIAYVRQGWWTDAHIIISDILKIKSLDKTDKEEFVNQLYLVLGYSFLQQEYFREARESFRNINKNSRYAIRAMLGIALAAASQGDNIGALNILNLLQQKDTHALPVEESYLLLPYIYEKLGQHRTASASYSIALAYYQQRVREINSLQMDIKTTSDTLLTIKNDALVIKNNEIDLSENHLVLFINNLQRLGKFKAAIPLADFQNEINGLINKYNILFKKIIIAGLKKRTLYLKSYQNQAQYGLARLYDNSKPN